MYRRFFCALLCALVLISFSTASAASVLPEEGFVRLHVVADGDGKYPQAVKLHVRNACLDLAQEILADVQTAEEAYIRLENTLPRFLACAEQSAREVGFSGQVRVETGVFSFPDRVYGEVTVPAGDYRALRVTLGKGEGHNWWCMLFPSLCVLDEAALAENSGSITFYSSVERFLNRLFGG